MLEGETLEYYDYVRRRLANAGFKYDPLEETRSMVRSLCEDLKYRVDAVDVAIKAGIHKRPQPDRLPNNIYGTDGDWETYSTPSRDARLKTAFKELRDEVARFLALAAEGSKRLAYAGEDIRRDICARPTCRRRAACSITYARSDGSEKQLAFAEVARRLFALSFDPHHCVERRWGAQEPEELATCADGADKRAWYEAQQRLRNQPDRTYDVRMGFSLADLRKAVPGSGIDVAPAIDVLSLLGDAPAEAGGIKDLRACGTIRQGGREPLSGTRLTRRRHRPPYISRRMSGTSTAVSTAFSPMARLAQQPASSLSLKARTVAMP